MWKAWTEPSGQRFIRGPIAVYDTPVRFKKPGSDKHHVEIYRNGSFRGMIDNIDDTELDVAMVFNHAAAFHNQVGFVDRPFLKTDMGVNGALLGRLSAGTLRLDEENGAVYATAALPDTSYAHDAYVLAERGDAPGGSFHMLESKTKKRSMDLPGGDILDIYDDVWLTEATVTPFPIVPQTANMRAFMSPSPTTDINEQANLEIRIALMEMELAAYA